MSREVADSVRLAWSRLDEIYVDSWKRGINTYRNLGLQSLQYYPDKFWTEADARQQFVEQIKATGLAREIHLETNITQDELGNGEYTEKAKRYNNNQSKTIVDITIGNPDLGQFDGFIELTCNLMFENKRKSAKFVNALTREDSKLDVEADRLNEAVKIGLCNDAFLCIVDDRFADSTDAFPMLERFIHEKYDSVTLLPVIGVGYYWKLDILQNAGESSHSSLY